jgi:glucans biosynthesis protein C
VKTGVEQTAVKSPRLAYIDNLRALVIVFVVLTHAAVTYSGLGSWFYTEGHDLGLFATLPFALYQSFAQAFSMGLLFLFAGYFIPRSLERKGTRRFVNDRLFRLGIPVLAFMFILHPLCVALSHPETDILRYCLEGITSLEFLSRSGPLWFAFALLIFTLVYVLVRTIFARSDRVARRRAVIGFTFTLKNALLTVLLTTAAAFGLRTAFPLGTDVANMQLGYFASYVVMFVIGIASYRSGLLDRIDYKTGKRWFIASFAVGLPLWFVPLSLGDMDRVVVLINGGLNLPAAAFAIWESFFCVAMIIGLVGIFKERFNAGRPAAKFLSDQAFGVYVFHAPVLIAITIAVKGIAIHPLLKFCFVSVLAVTASFAVSWAIRRVGFLRAVFS